MAEKLTLADCYKYNKSTITSEPTIHVFSNVKVVIEYAHENMLTIQEIIDFNNLKLILRDLSQLTDEENIELKKLYEEAIAIAEKDETMSWESSKTIVDYFRKIGVDIDGMFASGKAVKDE